MTSQDYLFYQFYQFGTSLLHTLRNLFPKFAGEFGKDKLETFPEALEDWPPPEKLREWQQEFDDFLNDQQVPSPEEMDDLDVLETILILKNRPNLTPQQQKRLENAYLAYLKMYAKDIDELKKKYEDIINNFDANAAQLTNGQRRIIMEIRALQGKQGRDLAEEMRLAELYEELHNTFGQTGQ
jgi:hypothetical protein